MSAVPTAPDPIQLASSAAAAFAATAPGAALDLDHLEVGAREAVLAIAIVERGLIDGAPATKELIRAFEGLLRASITASATLTSAEMAAAVEPERDATMLRTSVLRQQSLLIAMELQQVLSAAYRALFEKRPAAAKPVAKPAAVAAKPAQAPRSVQTTKLSSKEIRS